MKKYAVSAFFGLMLVLSVSSCFHHHDISITQTDDEDEYEMKASYRKSKTHDVQIYINDRLLHKNSVSIKRKAGNDVVTLNNNATLYINSSPGEIRIRVDKRKNTEASYHELKEICEDLKDILTDH